MNKTGIIWLPKISDSWSVARVKNLFNISKEQAQQENPVILSLARSGIKVRDITNNEGQLAESYYNYNIVKKGDLLLNPMDLYSGANCNVSEIEGVISPAYCKLRAKPNVNPKFYDYYFKIQYWTMAMFAHGKGVSFDNRWTLSTDSLLNYEVPFPDYYEQNKIVDFLNTKLNKIDSLIDIQKKQIDQLKQKLNSTRFYKTTGYKKENRKVLDWYTELPSKWNLISTKRIFDVYSGATPDSGKQEYWDGSIAWITPSDFKTEDKYTSAGKRNITKEGYNSCATTLVPAGSIIISKRAPIGTVVITRKELCTNQGCLSCVKKMNINIDYYYHLMASLSDIYNLFGNGTTFKEISFSSFCNFLLPFPPIDVQNSIADELNKLTDNSEKLIKLKEQKIEKLEEYKKTLIYEYITGIKETN